jgi:hypothetical protein
MNSVAHIIFEGDGKSDIKKAPGEGGLLANLNFVTN